MSRERFEAALDERGLIREIVIRLLDTLPSDELLELALQLYRGKRSRSAS